MLVSKAFLLLMLMSLNGSYGQMTQKLSSKSDGEEDSNPLFDMASMFIQEAMTSQNRGGGGGGAAGLSAVASLIGTFMQANNGQGKSTGSGAMQILSGIGSLLANAGNNNGRSGSGFDPSIIGNVIEMFTQAEDNEEDNINDHQRHKKRESESGIDLGSIIQIASAFMGQNNEQSSHNHQQKRSVNNGNANNGHKDDNALVSLLPLVMQAVSSFAGPEGQHTQERHKDHAWVLPPFLEHIHVLWDHFSSSELADALYEKSGVNKILKVFKGRDGKVDYDKLFESLNNQSFRRRWIKSATLYLADWASYLANPEVYLKYFQTAQFMFNGFLKSQGYPKSTLFDPSKPSETISNLLDHVAKHHLNVKIDSRQYVKPAVGYAKDLLKLGQARGLLQFNSTEISDKLTDTLNLEVIEPVLKVHRAYRYVSKQPQCDRYVLCRLNDPEQYSTNESRGLISGVSPKIIKVGSMGAAFFISTETGTPFWTLFSVITSASNCEVKYPADCIGFHEGEARVKYPADCIGFHEGEARVTTEYIHNEL